MHWIRASARERESPKLRRDAFADGKSLALSLHSRTCTWHRRDREPWTARALTCTLTLLPLTRSSESLVLLLFATDLISLPLKHTHTHTASHSGAGRASRMNVSPPLSAPARVPAAQLTTPSGRPPRRDRSRRVRLGSPPTRQKVDDHRKGSLLNSQVESGSRHHPQAKGRRPRGRRRCSRQ